MSSILKNGRDRQTPRRNLGLVVLKMKADAVIAAGVMVCVDATGYAIPAAAATGLTFMGRAEEFQDNTGGADGELSILVRNHSDFLYENSANDPVTQSQIGQLCYIQDDVTVAKTDAGGTLSAAGRVVEIDVDGVWIQ
ncbi:hypothetical protein [Acinetobacter piscicola]|uniref:hypothetical protein n=1 Tax=Acinetobacter piscicola TaxID=2006115 RepID=UPI0010204513|nr:hypothetical protein [Acinetobacter piscicola]RYL25158.1 hypothetical protein EWP19_13385 [Acinetobacter piscicola]